MLIDITDILKEEGEISISNISSNIIRNKQNASGRTIQSLREEATDTELSIFAQESITTLQTGVLPGTKVSPSTINAWGKIKGYWEQDNSRPYLISRNIFNLGSLVYRKGGRTDVYTSEIPSLLEQISNRIGKRVIETKILE
jgi:hypothetical protein